MKNKTAKAKTKSFSFASITHSRSELMDIPAQLTLEQQFKLQVLKEQVEGLTKEQAQDYLLEVFRQMMVKDNLVKHLLRNNA